MAMSKFLSAFKASKKPDEEFPLLPLRGVVLFPNTIAPIFVTFKDGIKAVEEAIKRDYYVFTVCKKSAGDGGTYYSEGCVAKIVQQVKLPDGTFRVILQGEYRATISLAVEKNECTYVQINPIKVSSSVEESELLALMRSVQKAFAVYAELSKKVSTDTISAVENAETPERLGNLVSNAIAVKPEQKVPLLGMEDTKERLLAIFELLEKENEIFGIQKKISGKVKSKMDKTQREYILNEQLREINKELGKDNTEDEFAELEKSIEEQDPPGEILAKARKEINRLRKLQPFSPEAGVLRAYLEWIQDIPWGEESADSGDLNEAEKILDRDHFNMKKAKERILEFIAVRQLTTNFVKSATVGVVVNDSLDTGIKGPILCFVGPPGTGKTSLGKSVARALGRTFVRISLGGVRDEAEIRGHRKTYVGALPGKIIQSMKKAGTMNPVFLLDEIDKLSTDFRGDPASALLEVLDPEQNSTFTDHYLEVPFDLSKVLFIATANSLHSIPYPLLDRMEIIEIPGYGEMEKLAIAKQFLVPKELKENGLSKAKITFTDDVLLEIIRHWTMESGVRSLEREIARCIRRVARDAVKKEYGVNPEKPIESFKKSIKTADLEKLLGRKKYKDDVVYKEARVGVLYGLAWTEVGGTILPVETSKFDGRGDLIMTGNLGDVMKESAQIALSYLRSVGGRYNFTVDDIAKNDFHVHVPEGAIPKDGPSAGITLASSLLSTLCRIPPKAGIAMTGELTLTGKILPIGGLKEKVLAAIRNGMQQVILPKGNEDDWNELDKEIKDGIKAVFAEQADEAFDVLFDQDLYAPKKTVKTKAPRKTPAKKEVSQKK
ncbi:MAG: endopeptidase La [Treponema sp.]|nr:endopeptidase La [Treponema sp.]